MKPRIRHSKKYIILKYIILGLGPILLILGTIAISLYISILYDLKYLFPITTIIGTYIASKVINISCEWFEYELNIYELEVINYELR